MHSRCSGNCCLCGVCGLRLECYTVVLGDGCWPWGAFECLGFAWGDGGTCRGVPEIVGVSILTMGRVVRMKKETRCVNRCV